MKSVLLLLAGLLIGANVVYFLMGHRSAQSESTATSTAAAADVPTLPSAPTVEPPSPTSVIAPLAATITPQSLQATGTSTATTPTSTATPEVATAAPPLAGSAPAMPAPTTLLIPVSGVVAKQLHDTFNDRRGSERRHEALDIMAPRGTPVLAAGDGKVEKLFDSKPGGLTIYQFDPTRTHAYYYAHLDRYAAGLNEGRQLRRGDVIGYVGSTGNASPDAPHLHFAIFLLGPEKRWWEGTAIDPYPLLSAARRSP